MCTVVWSGLITVEDTIFYGDCGTHYKVEQNHLEKGASKSEQVCAEQIFRHIADLTVSLIGVTVLLLLDGGSGFRWDYERQIEVEKVSVRPQEDLQVDRVWLLVLEDQMPQETDGDWLPVKVRYVTTFSEHVLFSAIFREVVNAHLFIRVVAETDSLTT